jgi:copper homeostasis protein
MNAQLEIACFDLESVIIADAAGADRIEICDNLAEGGTTPSWEMVFEAKERIKTDLFVMIRPRGGDFCYNEDEFEQMKNDIVLFKRLGVQGYVFGILTKDNEVDIERNKDLIAFAHPFPCTFHRAFDRTNDVYQSLETIISLGFQTILTSGAAQNVTEGLSTLKSLVQKAGTRISIMPGGGLRSSNIALIKNETAAHYYHSSAIVDASLLADQNEIQLLKKGLK